MTETAKGTFEQTSWSEDPYFEMDGQARLTMADVAQKFEGAITADGSVRYLMCYRQDQTATYVGFQRISGQLDGRSGSAVLQLTGAFDGKEAKTDWTVVEGSSTGGWSGLEGRGGFVAPHGSQGHYTLEYEFVDTK